MARLNGASGLIPRVAAIEASIPIAKTLTTNISTFNGTALPTSGGHSFVVAFTLPYRAKLVRLRMRLQGNGPGGAGTQPTRAVAYAGTGVSGLPSSVLLGTAPAVTLTNPSAASTYQWTFDDGVIANAGGISAGIQPSLSGTANQAMTILTGSAPSNSTLSNNDTYEDGAVSPFGTITAGYSGMPLVELDIEPAAQTGVTIDDNQVGTLEFTGVTPSIAGDTATIAIPDLSDDVDDLDSRVDALEGADSGGGVEANVDFYGSLAADDVFVGAPEPITNPAALSVASGETSGDGDLQVDISPDAGTWSARATAASTTVGGVDYADLSVIAFTGYVRRKWTQGTAGTTKVAGTVS